MTERVEVAVIGAGPGGLSAALSAARAGAQVTLIDSYDTPGGQYHRQMAEFLMDESTPRQRQGRELWRKVTDAGVRLLSDTVVWGTAEDQTLALHGPEAPPLLQAQAIILATGAYDRPVAFPGWTLPGVMTAGAARTLLTQGVVPGERVLLAGTGPLQLVVCAELVRAGVEVVAVLEGADYFWPAVRHLGALWGQWERLGEGLSSRLSLLAGGVPYRTGWGVVAASGADQVDQVTIARLDKSWYPVADSEQTVACDTLCIGYGFVPNDSFSALVGARGEWRLELGGRVPERNARMETSVPGVYAVGDAAGIGGGQLALVEGKIAGIAAAAQAGHAADSAEANIRRLRPALDRERRFQHMYADLFTPGPGLYGLSTDDTVLCRCEEVTQADARRALSLGADSVNEVKSITRCGMGDCQGRVCGHLLAHFLARATGRSVAKVGLPTSRPPIQPIPISALAGERTDLDPMMSAEAQQR
jgi:NADPH-dependent 2,4-dienoyl-CoA reductase/sulfur reductase-like enzyme